MEFLSWGHISRSSHCNLYENRTPVDLEITTCGYKYVYETNRCLKDRMFNHIKIYIHRNKNDLVSRNCNYADNTCFGADESMILYPIEPIPDQCNAQRSKSHRLKRELYWIKTLGTQFPHGMKHKIWENVIYSSHHITFIYNARKTFKSTKNIYTTLWAIYPDVFKWQLMCSLKRSPREPHALAWVPNSFQLPYKNLSVEWTRLTIDDQITDSL